MPMDKKMAIATSTAKKATKISNYRADRNKHMEEEVKEDLAVPLIGGDQKDDESAEMAKLFDPVTGNLATASERKNLGVPLIVIPY